MRLVPGKGSLPTALALLVAAVLTVAAPATAGDGRAKPDERVTVQDNFFSARSATVAPGGVVRWTWRGTSKHNIVFKHVPRGGGKRGADARRKGRWQRAFDEPGSYRYVCTLFTGMRGTITVTKPPPE